MTINEQRDTQREREREREREYGGLRLEKLFTNIFFLEKKTILCSLKKVFLVNRKCFIEFKSETCFSKLKKLF
jgi:hypothetical protein